MLSLRGEKLSVNPDLVHNYSEYIDIFIPHLLREPIGSRTEDTKMNKTCTQTVVLQGERCCHRGLGAQRRE